MSAGWAQLRQQARSLETQTENLFHTYAQYNSSAANTAQPSAEEQRTETQIEELIAKRSTLLNQLSRALDTDSTASPSALKTSNLARHRDIHSEHTREFARLRGQLREAHNRAALLSNVRADITAYRASNSDNAEAEYMLDERGHIDNSHRVADGVLSQAYAISDSMQQQRESLASINRRIIGAAGQIPGINSLMSRIGAKKRRDGIILGSFIALCFLAVYFMS